MTSLFLVGLGGAAGSILRYELGRRIAEKATGTFPLGTFLINISGAMALGLLMNLGLEPGFVLLLGTGFLGAYTTFSTFMYEGFYLYQENDRMKALQYVASSLLIGVIGYMIGAGVMQL